jgi:hypothetical protein
LLQNPIKDYCLPIRSLQRWFNKSETRTKRSDIAKLIRELAAKQFPGKKFNFPNLLFQPVSGSGYTTNEDDSTDDGELESEKSTKVSAGTSLKSSCEIAFENPFGLFNLEFLIVLFFIIQVKLHLT